MNTYHKMLSQPAMPLSRPVPGCYWVWPGRLLAGEYPGARDRGTARRRLRHFLDAGVTFFLDLTVEGESGLRPYAPLLPRKTLRAGAPVHYQRMAIRDMSTPTLPLLQQILTTLDGALAGGHTVYVHCWAGIGRTGTVIGCYLVQQGMSPSQAFQTIAHLLQNTPRSHRRSPETEAQRQVVQQWAQHYHGVAQPNEEAES